MKTLINAIKNFFSEKKENMEELNDKFSKENLPVYVGKIEVDKYMEIKGIEVKRSEYYLFRTPDAILKILDNRTFLWVDEKNDLLGYSNVEITKLFIFSDIKGFEIQNMLPAKGGGGSWISVCLPNEKSCKIAEAGEYSFDTYADEISNTTGLPVTFLPEYYNC